MDLLWFGLNFLMHIILGVKYAVLVVVVCYNFPDFNDVYALLPKIGLWASACGHKDDHVKS